MRIHQLKREIEVKAPLPVVFEFFSRAENLEKITPPWMRFHILTKTPIEMRQGTNIAYTLRVHGVPLRWLTEIVMWNPPIEFVDVQKSGPYALWRHHHQFSASNGGTRIIDVVDYALPLGILGQVVHRLQVARDLEAIFDYRASQVRSLLERGDLCQDQHLRRNGQVGDHSATGG